MIGPIIIFTQWGNYHEPVGIDLLSIRAVYFRGADKVEVIRSDAGSTYVIGTVVDITNQINKARKKWLVDTGVVSSMP